METSSWLRAVLPLPQIINDFMVSPSTANGGATRGTANHGDVGGQGRGRHGNRPRYRSRDRSPAVTRRRPPGDRGPAVSTAGPALRVAVWTTGNVIRQAVRVIV